MLVIVIPSPNPSSFTVWDNRSPNEAPSGRVRI